jgi:hypothetical protein
MTFSLKALVASQAASPTPPMMAATITIRL